MLSETFQVESVRPPPAAAQHRFARSDHWVAIILFKAGGNLTRFVSSSVAKRFRFIFYVCESVSLMQVSLGMEPNGRESKTKKTIVFFCLAISSRGAPESRPLVAFTVSLVDCFAELWSRAPKLSRASLSFELLFRLKRHTNTAYKWFAEFKCSRVNLSDEFRDSCPSTAMNNKNINVVHRITETDKHVTYHEIQDFQIEPRLWLTIKKEYYSQVLICGKTGLQLSRRRRLNKSQAELAAVGPKQSASTLCTHTPLIKMTLPSYNSLSSCLMPFKANPVAAGAASAGLRSRSAIGRYLGRLTLSERPFSAFGQRFVTTRPTPIGP
ncbi:hypothetical protein EVAR_87901_1 [Eumeta japonica]|uniref:Uncharacterized protein n=1 Tax=Eumeta variegata TaxID=151549 RepID=A0A4C1WTU6_EUMVA|nr:hypothetical protein EVAR_87901_1 [Eumeta japonica]